MTTSVHEAAFAALMLSDPKEKCAAVLALADAFSARHLRAFPAVDETLPIETPGRPERPFLVSPNELPRRKIAHREGHGALLHAIAHIEFNAINLALDCIYRFRSMPETFHRDWIQVAKEEAEHFGLVQARLQKLGFMYGDFTAHNGLWEMACKTAHDVLIRMALVPRVLEARGLDATPQIMERLKTIGDLESVAVLEVILKEEVRHVAIGDHWFRMQCHLRCLEPEETYFELMQAFNAPRPHSPLHYAARRAAGFSEAELRRLTGKIP